jgi:hypothetical protein
MAEQRSRRVNLLVSFLSRKQKKVQDTEALHLIYS